MFKKILSLSLILTTLLMMNFHLVQANNSFSGNEEARVEKVKAGVRALGTGADAKVKIKLRDNRKLKGYISRADEDAFIAVEEKSGEENIVSYEDVKQIKGNNLSTNTKVIIGVAIAAAIVGVIIAILANRNEGDDRCRINSSAIGIPCPPGCVCAQ